MRPTQLQEAQSRDVQLLFRGVPFSQYQFIDVSFTNADEDVRLRHELKPIPVANIGYIVVRQNKATSIYDGTVSTWDANHFSVKSSEADAEVTLLVFTRR